MFKIGDIVKFSPKKKRAIQCSCAREVADIAGNNYLCKKCEGKGFYFDKIKESSDFVVCAIVQSEKKVWYNVCFKGQGYSFKYIAEEDEIAAVS